MSQRGLVKLLGVSLSRPNNWETGKSIPDVHLLPKIYEFLGYVPYPPSLSFGQKLKIWRESWGLDRGELAKKLGVKHDNIGRWERDGKIAKRNRKKVLDFFLGKDRYGL